MGGRKNWSAIDATPILIHKFQNIWKNRKIAGTLLIDVKDIFDHVFQANLAQWMVELSIDDYLIRWTQSSLTDGSVMLLIDRFINPKCKVEIEIL